MKKNIVIVILLLALIGAGAYIGYDKFYVEKQEENKTEPKKEDKTESKAEELSINSTLCYCHSIDNCINTIINFLLILVLKAICQYIQKIPYH